MGQARSKKPNFFSKGSLGLKVPPKDRKSKVVSFFGVWSRHAVAGQYRGTLQYLVSTAALAKALKGLGKGYMLQ